MILFRATVSYRVRRASASPFKGWVGLTVVRAEVNYPVSFRAALFILYTLYTLCTLCTHCTHSVFPIQQQWVTSSHSSSSSSCWIILQPDSDLVQHCALLQRHRAAGRPGEIGTHSSQRDGEISRLPSWNSYPLFPVHETPSGNWKMSCTATQTPLWG